jgi:predicted transcriptional regulator
LALEIGHSTLIYTAASNNWNVQKMPETNKLALIAEIAASYLRRNSVGIDQIGTVVTSVTNALEEAAKAINGGDAPETRLPPTNGSAEGQQPAVPIKKSIQPEYIVCLEDGLHARTLKRHLRTAHGMTPEQYREKWGLPDDYSLIAPAYSESRSKMAKKLGLGRKAGTKIVRRKRRSRKSAI